jgi:LytS/YehU family sensor histidine kinase
MDKKTKEVLVPPMMIQTLVENAINHSINNLPNGGEILVESKLSADFLTIYVKNTGQIKTEAAPKRRGIGITNAKERLRLLYGEKASLSVENINENMVCATVKIPLFSNQ